MDSVEDHFARLIEARLDELKESAFSFEQKAGLPSDAVRNIIRKDSRRARPNLSRIKEICDLMGLEIYIGPPRDRGSAPPSAPEKEYANVPLHNASLAAGSGLENGTEEIIDYLAFRRDWLRKIGVRPSNAVLARADGDSMQPTIWPGDMVLIDTARIEIPVRGKTSSRRRSPIYAVLDNGVARVKRIARPDEDQVILLSDNPDHSPEFSDVKTLSIIGKVMWWGHTSKE